MPMNRALYPPYWEAISYWIRFVRAKSRCEWRDEKGKRCKAIHLQSHPITGSKVVLTTAHLEDENPMNCDPKNLAAMCQLHHLSYDRQRRKNKRENLRSKQLEEQGVSELRRRSTARRRA